MHKKVKVDSPNTTSWLVFAWEKNKVLIHAMDKGKIKWIDYLDIVDGDLSHWNDPTWMQLFSF